MLPNRYASPLKSTKKLQVLKQICGGSGLIHRSGAQDVPMMGYDTKVDGMAW